ncbi:MAG: transketolase [bacterium]|nr:transketolase [bacterium]
MSNYITEEKIKELELAANKVRQTIIEMLVAAGSGHTAGPLGMADVFTAFYFHILNHDPKKPDWEERDRLILSNGHIVPVRYATMAHAGYFPVEECLTLRKFHTRLQGHPERERLPGVESVSGPLGSGLGQAAGMAYAARMDGKKFRTYCLMSDGEHDTGNIWESVMFAGKYKLANLTGVIDRNNIQIDGVTEDIMPLENLRGKYEAFNWHVLEVDGHNMEAIVNAVEEAKAIYEKPTVIIAHTIPGKGIPEIEFDFRWHGIPPGKGPTDKIPATEQAKHFLHDLRTMQGKIKSEHQ